MLYVKCSSDCAKSDKGQYYMNRKALKKLREIFYRLVIKSA